MGLVTCRIQATSATITLDDGQQLTIPRRLGDPPERTAASVARLLCVDRFEYAVPSSRGGGESGRFSSRFFAASAEPERHPALLGLPSAW
jgi:hypothetical protein